MSETIKPFTVTTSSDAIRPSSTASPLLHSEPIAVSPDGAVTRGMLLLLNQKTPDIRPVEYPDEVVSQEGKAQWDNLLRIIADLKDPERKGRVSSLAYDNDGKPILIAPFINLNQLSGVNLTRFFEDQGISLSDAQLKGALLKGALLNNARLNGALLNNALLDDALLNKAQLNNAQLIHVLLNNAQLSHAQVCGAQLYGAQLNGAQLNYAQFDYAQLNDAKFDDSTALQGTSLREISADYIWINGTAYSVATKKEAIITWFKDKGVKEISFAQAA